MAASRLVIAPAAALLLGAALLAWAWWGLSVAEAEAPRPAATAIATQAPAPSAPEAAAPAPMQATRPAPAMSLAGLLTAPDSELRATLQLALAARPLGGRLYARTLARRCATLASLRASEQQPDANDARHQRAVARQAALASGCGQFANAEWLALVNVAADESTADDPLLSLLDSSADDAPLLNAVFTHPDPLLLDELGERLLLRRVGGEPMLYFDGRRFDDDTSRATAQAALRLLPCHFGLACDERDPDIWLACLRGDGCVFSRFEQAPAEAQALAERIAAALRARELGRFMPAS